MNAATAAPELGAKAELLDLLLNATQDGIVDLDLVTGEATYNPRWKHLLGFDSEELAEYHETPELWRELIHPDERAATQQLLTDHLEQGWPFVATVRMRHRYGGYRHILCRGAAHRDDDDHPLRMVIIFSDIDERIRAEERQKALVSALPDTLFRISGEGKLVGLKRGVEREGSPFATLREGLTLSESINDRRVVQRLQMALNSSGALLLQEGEAQTLSVTSTPNGGTAAIHHEVRIVRSGEDECVCIVRDVTEQRELEDRLLQTQKLGAIGQLAAGVAHEINTPMQFIGDNLHFSRSAVTDLLGLVDVMKRALDEAATQPLPPDRVEELKQAELDADFEYSREALPSAIDRSLEGVDRVTKIVRAMKSFAHPGGDQLTPTDWED